MALLALTFLLITAPAFADEPASAPAAQEFVDPGILKARADALRDSVADTRVSDISVKSQAYGFFDKLPEERLVVATGNYRRMERESVAGKVGSIEGMQEAADRRIAEWKRTHREPPPPELTATIAEARVLAQSKRLSYDTQDELSPNQMGLFIVDLEGDEVVSRAVIRKGQIVCIDSVTEAGQKLSFFDNNGKPIGESCNLKLWVRDRPVALSS